MRRVVMLAITAAWVLSVSPMAPTAAAAMPRDRTQRLAGHHRPERWETLAPAPTPRTEAGGAAVGNEIYLVGGFVPGGATVPLVEIYDIESDTWRVGPPLPIPVNHPLVASTGDELFVFGGYLGPAYGGALQPLSNPTDRAFVLRDGRWQPIAPLPSPRAAGGAAVAGDEIFLVGGMDADSLATETLVYDVEDDSWSTARSLRYPRQHLGVASHDERVYAIGGRVDLLTSNMGFSEVYDPSARRWRRLPLLGVARGGLGAAATRSGLVVAIGGEFQSGVFEQASALDVRTNKWRDLPPLPTPRHGLAVVSVGDRVYAIAGGTQPGYSYSTANEVIDLGA
ncbi:MAG TPA: kelch repeat-containing protein [Actinomycetota bacterium]|nr:kelch repeat-containing protein [Actinomycetota bacterium]